MDTVIVKAEEDIAKTEVDLEGAAVVTTSLNLTAPIGHTTRMEPNPDLSRIWISLRTCLCDETLATGRTSPEAVEVCHLQNIVLSEERTNQINDN